MFLGQVALYSGSKRYEAKGLVLPVCSGWGQLAPNPNPEQLSTVTLVKSSCSLRLPGAQSHSFQKSLVSHTRRSLGKGRGA